MARWHGARKVTVAMVEGVGVTSLKFTNQIHSLKIIFKTYCKNLSFELKLLCHLIFTMHLIYIQLPFLLHFLIKLVSFSSP